MIYTDLEESNKNNNNIKDNVIQKYLKAIFGKHVHETYSDLEEVAKKSKDSDTEESS